MKKLHLLLAVSAVALVGASATAFAQAAHTSGARAVVTAKHTSLGTILVTGSGKTLYLDVGDKPPHFACNGGCISAWPLLQTSGKPIAKGGAVAADLGTVKHGSATQVTYKGHPLYLFVRDTSSNPTSGEGVNGFYVVSPSGSKITHATQKTTSSSTSSSGGGYGY
jgi:predicted lipoprotein with Yx(FWY)xxD motif